MNHTNGDSTEEKNYYCAVAQTILTEKEIQIPSAKPGPTKMEVMLGEGMELPVYSSEVKNNEVVSKDGTTVMPINIENLIEAKQTRTERSSKYPNTNYQKGKDGNLIVIHPVVQQAAENIKQTRKTSISRER